jgi:hypothetical protein
MWRAELPKGCANHNGRRPKVKGNGQEGYDLPSLAGFSPFGECEFAAAAQNAREEILQPG